MWKQAPSLRSSDVPQWFVPLANRLPWTHSPGVHKLSGAEKAPVPEALRVNLWAFRVHLHKPRLSLWIHRKTYSISYFKAEEWDDKSSLLHLQIAQNTKLLLQPWVSSGKILVYKAFLLLYLFYITMRILAPFAVLGLIRKREQVAGNRKGSEEHDQMFYGSFFLCYFRREKKLKENKPRL